MQKSYVEFIATVDASEAIATHAPEQEKLRKKALLAHCNAFKGADTRRSLVQLTFNLAVYGALMSAMLGAFLHEDYLLAYGLLPVASFMLVRLFIIQHDCGHGSFFNTRRANTWTGRIISLLTFTPYEFWRRAHAMHHATSGNLNRRGIGSLDTLTVAEYDALPQRERRIYRVYRSYFSQAVVIPIVYIFFIQRFPPSQSLPFLKEYTAMPFKEAAPSVFTLDAALIAFLGAMCFFLGWKPVLLVYIPTVMLTTLIGGWLFFIQHQFEDTYWNRDKEWNFFDAAIYGSSYYVLPKFLQWFTGNIGIHHIHHLCSMIPNYKLQACLDANPELQKINRLTLRQSFRCLRWALWDEGKRQMVSFGDLKRKPVLVV